MLKSLLNIFFPPVCPLCEGALKKNAFCGGCEDGFAEQSITVSFCTVCGIPFASGAAADHTCGQCLTEEVPFKEARSAFIYDGNVLDAVHKLKYGAKVILAESLGELLLSAALKLSVRPEVVVPVPLHSKRLKARGFNQSLLLSRAVAKRLSLKLDYLSLRRTRPTVPQINLERAERQKNVKGAFEVGNKAAFKGKSVLLIDDVLTTGATVKECSKVLKKAGAEVFVATLARAVKA